MTHYFRLLFVSFVLFLLLGLNEKQSEDSGSSRPVAANLAHQHGHDGILPAEEWIASEPALPVLSGPLSLQSTVRKKQEIITHSQSLQSRYIFYTGAFLEYRPGIAWKTGHLLHFQSHKGDPSLA